MLKIISQELLQQGLIWVKALDLWTMDLILQGIINVESAGKKSNIFKDNWLKSTRFVEIRVL